MKKSLCAAGIALAVVAGAGFVIRTRSGGEAVPAGGPSTPEGSLPDRHGVPPPTGGPALHGTARVKIGGALAGGARLELRRTPGPPLRAVADDQGGYAFDRLVPGVYTVSGRLHPKGRPFELGVVDVKRDGPTRADLEFPAGPVLEGVVETGDGRRPDVVVMAVASVGDPDLAEQAESRPSASGRVRYVVEGVSGPATVVVAAAGYLPSEPLRVDIGDRNLVDLVFRLKAGGAQGGTVVDEQDRPVSGALVNLTPRSFPALPVQKTTTDAHGRFDFPALPPDTYACSVKAVGHAVQAHPAPVGVTSGARGAPLQLRVRRGWAVTGVVVDARGQSVRGARVSAKEGAGSSRATTRADGRFELAGLQPDADRSVEPGLDLLTCEAEGYGQVRYRNVNPGADLRIVLGTPGGLEVVLRFAEGPLRPDSPWSIWLKAVPGREEAGGLEPVSAWRVFSLKGEKGIVPTLQPGAYEAVIRAPGREPFAVQATVYAGRTTRVDAVLAAGGEGEAGALSLSLSDPATFERELRILMNELPESDRAQLLQALRTQAGSYPAESAKRRMLEDALKRLGGP